MAKPKQERLPGTQDAGLQDIHDAALAYVEARDERMDKSKSEKKAKDELLALMKTHRKKHYNYDGIEVEVIVEKEKLKVKVRGEESEEEEEESEE